MGLAETFILTLGGSNGSIQTRNVFQYQVNETFPSVEDVFPELLDAFENFFLDGAPGTLNAGSFHTAQKYESLAVYNLGDPSPFLERLLTGKEGAAAGEQLPRFVAYSMRSAKKSRGIRRGFKRFGGVPESAANAGQIVTAVMTDLGLLAILLGSTIQKATAPTYSFTPIVVKRVQYITPSGTIAYRFPESQTEYSHFVADEWEIVDEVTTQNTRKRGVGI